MPFCEYCGRPITENEVCNCRSGAVPPPPPVYANGQPVYGTPQGAVQKKDGGLWWIWLIIVPFVLIFLIIIAMLAAIFVPAYIGYNKKSEITSANTKASSVYKAVNTALVEFDEEGYNVNGFYIISSDEEYNWNVPFEEDELEDFYKKINTYYNESDKYEWFVCIERGAATYSAEAESWSSDVVGTYPNRATVDGPRLYGRYSNEMNKMSLSLVYNQSSDQFSRSISEENEDNYYTFY